MLKSDTSILLNDIGRISGLSLTGQVIFDNDSESYVRVVVHDINGLEYLVYESYPMLSGSKEFHIDDVAYESALLDNVEPESLCVFLHNAKLRLKSIHYNEERNIGEYGVEGARLFREQAKQISTKLNKNLVEKGALWRAGVTDLSDLTYEEKKSKFGNPLPEYYGFEYYVGGVFQMPSEANESLVSTQNETSPQYVDKWDWRSRHGKNWMTPVKDNGWCRSCWATSTIDALETYINLYYNRLINYDLSEQELLSCSGAGSCENGGYADLALSYIEQNGVVEEDCFPYTATTGSCSNKCSNPSERIFIGGHEAINCNSITEDSLKRVLWRAPIVMGIRYWAHSVLLLGYKEIHAGDTIFIRGINQEPDSLIVPIGHSLIGQTAWIIKNNYLLY